MATRQLSHHYISFGLLIIAMNLFLAHEAILDVKPNPQYGSPFLRQLPPEVRSRIYAYALTDYPDPSPAEQYERTVNWTRPSYSSLCRTDTALLSTCRLIYRECWFMPFYLCEYVEWLTSAKFSPPRQSSPWNQGFKTRKARRVLREAVSRGKGPRALEINNMHFFSQSAFIDGGLIGRRLRTLVPLMHPRTITLTIRYWDWLNWMEDEPPELGGRWIPQVCRLLPGAVTEIRIELESVKRKAHQVRQIAAQMKKKWFFVRRDGVRMFAGRVEEGHWRGSSLWNGTRWVRDETAPGMVDYVIMVVSFRLENVLESEGVSISQHARELSQQSSVCACKLKLKPRVLEPTEGWVHSLAVNDGDCSFSAVSPHWTQRLRETSALDDSQSADAVEGEASCGCDKALLKFWHRPKERDSPNPTFNTSLLGGYLEEMSCPAQSVLPDDVDGDL